MPSFRSAALNHALTQILDCEHEHDILRLSTNRKGEGQKGDDE